MHLSMLEGGALPPRYNNFLLAVMAVAMILTVLLRWLPVELLFVFGGFILLIGVRDASEWRRQHTPKEATDAVAETVKSTHLLKEEEERKREEKRIRYEAEVEAEVEAEAEARLTWLRHEPKEDVEAGVSIVVSIVEGALRLTR